jgi:nucleoside-diphosphate-sugar epimerase
VEDADERADEVVRISVFAQFAAGDGAFDRRDEGSLNETARAFDQSQRAARDGIHGRDDERFGGHMVDEEKHPGAERFNRWQGGGETLLGTSELFNFAAVDGFDEGVTRAEKGVHVAIVRLPQVHDTRKQGLVPLLTQMAREKGVSAYVGDGANRWAAAPLKDVAHLYRLAVEKTGPGVTVYNAVQEEGVSAREIAETIGKGLKVPAVSIAPEMAGEHFGWLAHFAALDMPASSEWTRKALGWEPTGPGLIEDLTNMKYF